MLLAWGGGWEGSEEGRRCLSVRSEAAHELHGLFVQSFS